MYLNKQIKYGEHNFNVIFTRCHLHMDNSRQQGDKNLAQLVEHHTSIAEVTGSNPVEALIFFRFLLSSCLNWKIYCDDHSSLSKT